MKVGWVPLFFFFLSVKKCLFFFASKYSPISRVCTHNKLVIPETWCPNRRNTRCPLERHERPWVNLPHSCLVTEMVSRRLANRSVTQHWQLPKISHLSWSSGETFWKWGQFSAVSWQTFNCSLWCVPGVSHTACTYNGVQEGAHSSQSDFWFGMQSSYVEHTLALAEWKSWNNCLLYCSLDSNMHFAFDKPLFRT